MESSLPHPVSKKVVHEDHQKGGMSYNVLRDFFFFKVNLKPYLLENHKKGCVGNQIQNNLISFMGRKPIFS